MNLRCDTCGSHAQMVGAGHFRCDTCGDFFGESLTDFKNLPPADIKEVEAMISDLQAAFHEAQAFSLGVYYPDEDPLTYRRGWEYIARKLLARSKD